MKFTLMLLAFAGAFAFTLFASDEKKEETKDETKVEAKASVEKVEVKVAGTQTLCPITGKKIDPKFFVDFQGSRIKFCSSDCEAKFLKAPADGFKKIAKNNETVDSIQTKCPASGDKLENYDLFVEMPGRKIYVCCEDCIPDFKKDEAKILNKLPGVKVKDGVKVK